jgi:hypothetical protein
MPCPTQEMIKTRHSERGAALVTVLLISTLLLATGGALILLTSTSSRTAIDSTAEMQAYYAAEAGMQNTLNVLRGNVTPNAAMPAGTGINFRNAITLSKSNLSTDTSTSPRLSGWLTYNYTPTGSTNPERIALTSSYAATTGLAYSVSLSDPDNTPVASGEPTRLLARVTGYGPKGAIKQLELLIKRSNIDYSPPAMLMMRGADDGTPVNFDIGNSNAKEYSGHDRAGSSILPTFGATSSGDATIESNADGKDTAANPKSQSVANASLPTWLQTAAKARAFLAEQKANAISQGRYFTSFDGVSGSTASPAFTFVDGDCDVTGGAGLFICTGTLTMKGNPDFSGMILVLGDGIWNRSGGGDGNIYGAMAVARFSKTGTGGFLAPTFSTNGGGNALLQYDSDAVRKALNATGPQIMGVHEY